MPRATCCASPKASSRKYGRLEACPTMIPRPLYQCGIWLAAMLLCIASSGCAMWPERVVEPQFHNPFPQIYRVAVLPFFNQSAEPTVDGDVVAMAYFNELQTIPGFEVMPVGVSKQMLAASISVHGREPRTGEEFQRLARQMGVDAVVNFVQTGEAPSGYTDTGVTLITDNPVEGVESEDTAFGLENCWG